MYALQAPLDHAASGSAEQANTLASALDEVRDAREQTQTASISQTLLNQHTDIAVRNICNQLGMEESNVFIDTNVLQELSGKYQSEFNTIGISGEILSEAVPGGVMPIKIQDISKLSPDLYTKIRDEIRSDRDAMNVRESNAIDIELESQNAQKRTEELLGRAENAHTEIDDEIKRLQREVAAAKKGTSIDRSAMSQALTLERHKALALAALEGEEAGINYLKRLRVRRGDETSIMKSMTDIKSEPITNVNPAIFNQAGLFSYFKGTLQDFIAEIKNSTSKGFIKKVISKVSSRVVSEANTLGLSIDERYKHVIDSYAVNHAMNRYGNVTQEALIGQIAITENDIAMIPEILSEYDTLENSRGALKYDKRMSDGSIIYIKEVRRGRKELAMVTMYKRKNGVSGESLRLKKPEIPTSETNQSLPFNDITYRDEKPTYTVVDGDSANYNPASMNTMTQDVKEVKGETENISDILYQSNAFSDWFELTADDEQLDFVSLLTENVQGNETAIESELNENKETENDLFSFNFESDESGRITQDEGELSLDFSEEKESNNEWLTEAGRSGKIEPVHTKIEDFGVKIGGAKKDIWKMRGLDISDMEGMTLQEKELNVKRENVWRKPDYRKLAEEGTPLWKVAAIKQVYDVLYKVPLYRGTKTESERNIVRQSYIESVGMVRDIVMKSETIETLLRDYQAFVGYDSERGKYLQEEPYVSRCYHLGYSAVYAFSYDKRLDLDRILKSLERDGAKLIEDPLKKRWHVSNRTKGEYVAIGLSVNRGKKSPVFDSEAKALEWARANEVKIDRSSKHIKGSGVETPEERAGADWRHGRNVSGDDILKTFGFRGGEFGNWLNQDERQSAMNAAYDGLMDLAAVLNLPTRAISLNGELGIAFGARGSGRAMAHYEPSKIVINLTKLSGGGALAHEWAHALDDYFGRKNNAGIPGRFVSSAINREQLREELKNAFEQVMNFIKFKDGVMKGLKVTQFFNAANRELNDKYWASNVELLARALSAYVNHKIRSKMEVSPYLVRNENNILFIPAEEEAPAIYSAFDTLFKSIKTRETESGTIELYQNGVIEESEMENKSEVKSKRAMPPGLKSYYDFINDISDDSILSFMEGHLGAIRKPDPNDRYAMDGFENLPPKFRGTPTKGYPIDVVHQHLESAGLINPDKTYASDLWELFGNVKKQKQLMWNIKKKEAQFYADEAAKQDKFESGKTSDCYSAAWFIQAVGKRVAKNANITFTRMNVPYRLTSMTRHEFIFAELNGKDEIRLPKSGEHFIRIDKGSMNVNGSSYVITRKRAKNMAGVPNGRIILDPVQNVIELFSNANATLKVHTITENSCVNVSNPDSPPNV